MPRRNDIAKILVIGSGPIVIGQSAEFDYSGTQACKALMAEGYVRQDDNLFSLRPRVLELGYSYLSPLKLPDLALPHLKALAGQVQESAYLSIVDGDENICIASAPVRRIWSMVMTVGTVLCPLFTFVFNCGVPGVCSFDELEQTKQAFAAIKSRPADACTYAA